MTDREKWDSRYSSSESTLAPPDQVVLEAIARHAPGRALDVACGRGRNAIHLARAGWSVLGVDVSPIGLKHFRRFASDAKVEVDAVAADLTQSWPIRPDAKFDLICDCRYLQPDLFSKVPFMLRTGGLFAAVIPMVDEDPLIQPMNRDHLVGHGELVRMIKGLSVLRYLEQKPREGVRRSAELLSELR